jgi:hypothetical protein
MTITHYYSGVFGDHQSQRITHGAGEMSADDRGRPVGGHQISQQV